MNIILKNSLKNIFRKPFRTILVVFAIFVSSLCALLCFDLSDSITYVLTSFMGNISRADFFVTAKGSDLSKLPDGFPEADYMNIVANSEIIYKPIDGEYCYVTTESLNIYGLDIDEAVDMKFIAPMELKDGEIYITKKFADDNGYKPGDKFILHDRANNEVELTVGQLLPDDNKNPLLGVRKAVVNLNTSDILCCGFREADVIMIDVKDNSKLEEAKKILEERYPDASVVELYLTESDMEMINELKGVFYLLFAVTFLLVIFVTASICNRIVSERMSFIGTLRSLGMSTVRTLRILLLENVLYALLGSIPATILYSFIRNPILDLLFVSETSDGSSIPLEMPDYPFTLVAGIILGAALIECLIPLRAILKALNTSIRDIIFDNRDTEYRFSRFTLISGLACLAVAIVTFFFSKSLVFATLCLITGVAALAFLFPRILRVVTGAVKKLADKKENSVWSLSAVEAISRKSTVGSGVLCATASAMCIIVYALSGALADNVNALPYDCDVIMESTVDCKYYSFIDHLEGVTGTEKIYDQYYEIKVNDEDSSRMMKIYAQNEDGFTYFTGLKDLPETLEDGSVVVNKKFAKRRGLHEGDSVKITYAPLSLLPIEREYKIAKIVEGNPEDAGAETLILTQTEYKVLFNDRPGHLLIRCSDPQAVKKAIETYAKGSYDVVRTLEEVIEDNESDGAKSMAVITTVIVVSLGMTAIGMISNQLIGFEGRKKECAVMLSTAMSKRRLSGILLREVLITSVTASAAGVIVGSLLTIVLRTAIDNAQSIILDVTIDPLKVLLFFVIMSAVFTTTVLFPIRNLRKMKISEQIKYE